MSKVKHSYSIGDKVIVNTNAIHNSTGKVVTVVPNGITVRLDRHSYDDKSLGHAFFDDQLINNVKIVTEADHYKLKPFNLEEALAGKPVITRDGRAATELHQFKTAGAVSVACVLDGTIHNFTPTGKHGFGIDSEYDLFMAPVKKTVWVNMWLSDGTIASSKHPFSTEEDALKHILTTEDIYIGTYPVEIEL